jgi:hypothetical protein
MRCFVIKSAPILLLAAVFASALPSPMRATDWSTLFTAQDVRDHLASEQGRTEALAFCRRMGISKVYIEAFRSGYQADADTLKTARDFFQQAGLQVAGCVTTTGLGKPSTGWNVAACYTNHQNQERLESIFRFAASIFDEIMIDDFFFTDCECSECAAAKGSASWRQYRDKLMLEMARDRVLAPARAVNPKVKIILKFPQWYDEFQNRGYMPDREAALFDRVWVGTETRNPNSDRWGHKQQYEGYFIYRWLTDLAGAPEVFLFHYGALNSAQYQPQADSLAAHRSEFDDLAKLVGGWRGLPAYKPVSSDPGDEAYLFDQLGMLAIPLAPTAHFPATARAAIFTISALGDTEFVPKLVRFFGAGGTAFLSAGLAHRLNADPRLPSREPIDLPKGSDLATFKEGNGQAVVFSDALPYLTYVDSKNQVAQPTDSERQALADLREKIEPFTVTSLDAPPRVALFLLGNRVAAVNFTELSVACKLSGVPAGSLREAFSTSGAALGPDGATLRLPPHALLMVEH